MRRSIFRNVGTLIAFRTEVGDAGYVAREF
jgi:hypothetical protein